LPGKRKWSQNLEEKEKEHRRMGKRTNLYAVKSNSLRGSSK